MKKCIILLSVFIGISCFNQLSGQVLKGRVIDSYSRLPVNGAHVTLMEKNLGTVTDKEGIFRFENITPGSYEIQITFVGLQRKSFVFDFSLTDELPDFIIIPEILGLEEIVVTASRMPQSYREVPGRIEVINNRRIISSLTNSIDNLFIGLSGINVDRTAGIYSRSVVGIRGITGSEQGRVLALVDGVPFNKSDGGSVNWNRIFTGDIERIEVFKGPGSSVYGSNAMGGMLNIIRKRPGQPGITGEISSGVGSYNTISGDVFLMGRKKENEGLYWSAGGRTRTSDGYIQVPDSILEDTDTKTYLNEKGFNTRIGYQFTRNTFVELDYNYYDDLRGGGTRIFAHEGAYTAYKTNFVQSTFKTTAGKTQLNLNAFWQYENYLRQTERLRGDDYTLMNVDSDRKDQGVMLNINYSGTNHNLVAGAEYRIGSVDAADVYKTSTDKVVNRGKMSFFSVFVQDNYKIPVFPLQLQGGVRYDKTSFYDGAFLLVEPTDVTNFMLAEAGLLEDSDWGALTSRVALLTKPEATISGYLSFSQGFRAATLDDMTRSGLISLGFKRANPDLKPERVNNFEAGLTARLPMGLTIESSVYHMIGEDFMYYLFTGEQILVGTRNRNIYKKQNISEVELTGFEIDMRYPINSHISAFANYTFTKTRITEFLDAPDLVGKKLTYSPDNQFNFGGFYTGRKMTFFVKIHYQDEQFVNDENTNTIEAFTTADIKTSLQVFSNTWFSLGIQNVFDKVYLRSTDQLSLGRFITSEIKVKF
jgi:iron complex outermembrane recepter protein